MKSQNLQSQNLRNDSEFILEEDDFLKSRRKSTRRWIVKHILYKSNKYLMALYFILVVSITFFGSFIYIIIGKAIDVFSLGKSEYVISYTIIVLLIAIGPLAITAINAALMAGSQAEAQILVSDMVMEGLATMISLILLGIILAILGTILVLSGTMNYAKTKQFGKAFAVVENLKNFFTGNFIVSVIVAIVLGIVAAAIMGAAMLIPIIGFIIALIVTVAINVMQISVLAAGYPSGTAVQGPQAKQPA